MRKPFKPFPACAVCLLGAALLPLALEAEAAQPIVARQGASLSNLARGKPCQVFSSHETQGWSAAKLTDGETSPLGWRSKAFAAQADHALYPEFVIVDLETNCALHRVLLYPRGDGTNAGQGFPADFTIQVCREGEPWQVVVEKRDYPAPVDGGVQSFDVTGTEGRDVKVEATRLRAVEPGSHRFQLAEIAVFGETAASAPLAVQRPVTEGRTTVERLRCENRDNPVGIDVPQPRLSWWMRSSRRGQRQTAYRVLLASSDARLARDDGDLWDSGKVTSDRSIAVAYGGRPLRSGRYYWWKVMLWDQDEQPTVWSEPARLMTGKLTPEDWQGQWIGADAAREPASGGVLGFAAEARAADQVEWVQVDLGSATKIDRVVLHPMRHHDPAAGGWLDGYAFPLRFRLELSDDETFSIRTPVVDHTQSDFPNPGLAQVTFNAGGHTARYSSPHGHQALAPRAEPPVRLHAGRDAGLCRWP